MTGGPDAGAGRVAVPRGSATRGGPGAANGRPLAQGAPDRRGAPAHVRTPPSAASFVEGEHQGCGARRSVFLLRSIAAHAGNTSVRCRVCGGISGGDARHGGGHRFIPAYGGNTTGPPNVRNSRSASSPRTRGTRSAPPGAHRRGRFIPAHAGNTSSGSPLPRGSPVHPRARGEHLGGASASGHQGGSSPRTRGTPEQIGTLLPIPRFIPAHAGNTRPSQPAAPA